MTIAERLRKVRASIPASVRLVAVSKTQPPEAIREAYAAGQRDFGENYAQEWRRKAEALGDLTELTWHFVGALQTNKVKVLARAGAGGAAWIHTVDREDLAREISRRYVQAGATARVLVEINVGGEASKSGCAPGDAPRLVDAIRSLPGIELRGFMCIPPADEDPRPYFAQLRALRDRAGLPDLSMGMSGDYPAAIEEGATIVRVGTAIFGSRPPKGA